MVSAEVAEAQVESWIKNKVERARRKARQKADNEVNREIDRQVDEAYDKTRESMKNKGENESSNGDGETTEDAQSSQQKSEEMLSALLNMKQVSVDKQYDFSETYVYDVEVKGDGADQSIDMSMMVPSSADAQYIGMKSKANGQEATMVIDHDLKAMLTIASGQGIYMSFDAIAAASANASEEELEEFSIIPSGKTDVHLGIAIKEFIYKSPDANGTIWVAADNKGANIYELFIEFGQEMNKNAPKMNFQNYSELGGMFIKSYMTSDDGSTSNMVLREIDKKPVTIDASKSTFMDMSAMSSMGSMYGN